MQSPPITPYSSNSRARLTGSFPCGALRAGALLHSRARLDAGRHRRRTDGTSAGGLAVYPRKRRNVEAMLATAAQEHADIANAAGASYRGAVRFATERLTRERRLSARDTAKLDRFTTETVARDVAGDVMAKLGTHNVRLVGGPGSGKSTTLALVAKRVVERDSRARALPHLPSRITQRVGASRRVDSRAGRNERRTHRREHAARFSSAVSS